MYYFHWTADLELGIEVIDKQHQRAVDYINLLQGAIELDDYTDAVYCAEKLTEYTDELFYYEEILLKSSDYALTEAHIASHNHFKSIAEKYKTSVIQSKDMLVVKQMCTELSLWLTEHIKKEDADYVSSVNHLFHKESLLDSLFSFFTVNNKVVQS